MAIKKHLFTAFLDMRKFWHLLDIRNKFSGKAYWGVPYWEFLVPQFSCCGSWDCQLYLNSCYSRHNYKHFSTTCTWQKLNLQLNFQTQSSVRKNDETSKTIFCIICNEKGMILKYDMVTCCNFLRVGASQYIPCILCMQRDSSWYETIRNFNLCSYRNLIGLSLLRSGPGHDFKTVLLSFLVTLATNFDAIFWNDLFVHLFNHDWHLKGN